MEVKANDMDSEIAAKVYMLNAMIIKESYVEPHHLMHPGVKQFDPRMVHNFYKKH